MESMVDRLLVLELITNQGTAHKLILLLLSTVSYFRRLVFFYQRSRQFVALIISAFNPLGISLEKQKQVWHRIILSKR